MKKISLFLSFAFAALFCNAQEVENAAVVKRDDPLKDYLRPSLTVIYVDRGESLSGQLIEQMKANGLSGKFNDNSIEHSLLSVKGPITETELAGHLEKEVTGDIVRRWFPYDSEKKEYSTAVIEERGMYNATDADVIAAKASARKDDLLKTAGLQLIDRSYIVVYDFYDTKRLSDENSHGYETSCNVYLYKLDWNPEVEALFYEQWENPDAIDQLRFPVKHIASIVKKSHLTPVKVTQSNTKDFLTLSEEKLFEAFTKEIEKTADVYLTQANEDFKVKAPIFAVSPIRAKIGRKEGLTVDQRYFAYEIELDEQGERVTKRKGVVRATSSIVKNDTVATGNGGTSKFYQVHGRKLQEGMLLQQKPDFGISISALGGSDVTVLGEFSVGMWLGKYIPSLQNLKVPYGTKIYLKYSLPLSSMEIDGDKLIDENDKEMTWSLVGVGISKDFYFARILSVTPYVGFSSLLVPEDYKESAEAIGKATSGFEAGLNLTIAVLHNVQLTGNAGYNGVKANWYSSEIVYGGGLRIQF
ncbi:MAG: hypothetical protein LBP50_05000 [Tannerella sp.]|jgi:hypothetical protein|nr:hypothetical protein [Tannerella sp.]